MRMKPISSIKADLGINANGRVQSYLVDTCYKKMDKYVPFSGDTGVVHLRENVDKGTNYITYESPYAHAQYIGIVHGSPVKNYTTPGTGAYWDKRMWSAEGQDVIRKVQEYVNRGK